MRRGRPGRAVARAPALPPPRRRTAAEKDDQDDGPHDDGTPVTRAAPARRCEFVTATAGAPPPNAAAEPPNPPPPNPPKPVVQVAAGRGDAHGGGRHRAGAARGPKALTQSPTARSRGGAVWVRRRWWTADVVILRFWVLGAAASSSLRRGLDGRGRSCRETVIPDTETVEPLTAVTLPLAMAKAAEPGKPACRTRRGSSGRAAGSRCRSPPETRPAGSPRRRRGTRRPGAARGAGARRARARGETG